MSRLTVYDMKGAAQGEMEVSDALLVLKRGRQAVFDVVLARGAAERVGGANTLGKGAVAGSGRKPWRQKGTGMARAGYRRSPVWRGGGVAHGPHPRDFSQRLSRKTRLLAFRRILSEKIADARIKVIDRLELEAPKTKAIVGLMKTFDIRGPAIIVLDRPDRKVVLAARNVPGLEVVVADNLNAYHALRYPILVATRAAMDRLAARLQPAERGEA